MALQLKSEKVTVTIPSDLKKRVLLLKDELNTSVSAIYKEALEAYIESKELKRWEEGAKLALKDEKYMQFVKEMSDSGDELYEY